MWKSIKQEFFVQRSIFVFGAALCGGFGALGVIIMLAVLRWDKTVTSYFALGTVMTLMVAVAVMIFVGAATIHQGFDDAVHMGKTRKRFLPAAALVIFVSSLACMVMAAILVRLEHMLYGGLYPHIEYERGPEGFLTAPWLLSYAAGITGVSCTFGAIIKMNRRVGGITTMVIWLIGCWSMSGFDSDPGEISGFQSIFHSLGRTAYVWYTGMPVWMRMGVLIFVGIAGYILMYFLLRKKAAD